MVQPLPAKEDDALAVLFFLYTPPALRALAHLSFGAREALKILYTTDALVPEAQEALLPRPLDDADAKALEAQVPPMCWLAHHASHQNGTYLTPSPSVPSGSQGTVELAAGKDALTSPNVVGSSQVEALKSPDQGVWHPPGDLLLR